MISEYGTKPAVQREIRITDLGKTAKGMINQQNLRIEALEEKYKLGHEKLNRQFELEQE